MSSLKITIIAIAFCLISGCNVSPLSPANRPRINNNGGEIGDIKNNQNGIMAELSAMKNRMDVMARDIENIQSGFINSNNKNSGIQIFQGDGGLIAGFSLLVVLALLATNYKLKADKYKKTAEIFGKQIRDLQDSEVEERVFSAALANKVEDSAYRILKG
jgi:hypothetical protein